MLYLPMLMGLQCGISFFFDGQIRLRYIREVYLDDFPFIVYSESLQHAQPAKGHNDLTADYVRSSISPPCAHGRTDLLLHRVLNKSDFLILVSFSAAAEGWRASRFSPEPG